MSVSNHFSGYYKTISNAELLNIIENPGDYQHAALEAAKKEFSIRNLSGGQITDARQELFEKQQQKIQQREKIKVVEIKLKKAGQTIFDKLNPFQTGITLIEKNIRMIVLAFAILFFYLLIRDFETTLFYIKGLTRFPLDTGFYLLPLILLPIATFLFWKRKGIGWILLIGWITFTVVLTFASLIYSFTWQPLGFGTFDNLFPRPSPTSFIIPLILLIWTAYVLCKPHIRDVFAIDDKKMYSAITLSALVTLALITII
jgi:hypothetical protein